MKICKGWLQALLSPAPRGFAARSRVLARLASLAQIGELARRLPTSQVGYHAGNLIERVVYCLKNQKISHCSGYKFSTCSSYIRVLRL